jgi:hypothetical protein
MTKPQEKINALDKDQLSLLYVYHLYAPEEKSTYLQYTAACALVYYLCVNGHFGYNTDELLNYDYLGKRLYIWESKKFMTDVNVLRDQGYLTRARLNSNAGRDVNAHQCTVNGSHHINSMMQKESLTKEYCDSIKNTLTCSKGSLRQIVLKEDAPYLSCSNDHVVISGFIKDFNPEKSLGALETKHKPFFLNL